MRGSVFFKFNVVTGETKVLMSREMFEKFKMNVKVFQYLEVLLNIIISYILLDLLVKVML